MKKNITLHNILNDRTSGSSEILLKLNEFIKNSIRDPQQIKLAIKQTKKNLSHFEVINEHLNSIEKIITSGDYNKLESYLSGFDSLLQSKYVKLYNNAKPFLKNIKTILTLSNSKTLLEVLKLFRQENKKLKIIICESRPKFEGKIFADALLNLNIKVELIYDFMISLYLPKVDAVIIGADKILKNGNVINKSGSKAAAILCRYFNKPFYVITTKEKFSSSRSFIPSLMQTNEVWNAKRRNLKISNIYFEEIPANLITKLITD